MAYVPDTNDPNAQPQPATAQNPVAPQTASGAGSPQGVASVQNATKPAPQTDLKAYLAANQPKAVQMGNDIAQNIGGQNTQFTGDINSAQQGIDQQIKSGSVAPNTDLVSRASSNPTDFVKNPGDVQEFQKELNASYAGPSTFESTPEYQKLQNEATAAKSSTPDLTKASGIQQAAQSVDKNPAMIPYDELLLESTPGVLDSIRGAIPKTNPQDLLSGLASKENASIQNAVSGTNAAKSGIQDAFLTGKDAVVPAWEKALQDEFSAAQGQTGKYNDAVKKIIEQENGMNSLVNNEESAVKANNAVFAGSPYAEPDNYADLLKAPGAQVNAPTLSSVATSDDYAREAALEQLLGSSLGTTPINQSTVGQAGSFKAPEVPTLPASQFEQQLQAILDRMNSNPAGVTAPRLPIAQNLYDSSQALLKYLQGLS